MHTFAPEGKKYVSTVCIGKGNDSFMSHTFVSAKPFDNWKEDFSFYYDIDNIKNGEIFKDALSNNKGWFVVSEKFKLILEKINTEIQFLPIAIHEKNNNGPSYTYYIANILTTVDALCLELSNYFIMNIPNFKPIYNIAKYGIYESKTEGKDLFKLTFRNEVEMGPIFISEKAKKIIERNNITEVSFRKLKTRE